MSAKMPEPPPVLDDSAFVREMMDAELVVRELREALATVPESCLDLRRAMLAEVAVAEGHLATLRLQARAEVERRRRAA